MYYVNRCQFSFSEEMVLESPRGRDHKREKYFHYLNVVNESFHGFQLILELCKVKGVPWRTLFLLLLWLRLPSILIFIIIYIE